MRRIAAVFASKRSDRSDAASSTAASSSAPERASSSASHKNQQQQPVKPHTRFFRSISRKSKPVDPVVNRLNSSDLHPPSSSSSSSGAPTTPDDDHGSLLRAPVSKAWLTLPHPADPPSPGSFLHPPEHHDRPPFHSPARARAPPSRQSTLDTEDDSSEESSVAPDLSRPLERSTPLAAPAYLLALTSNNLRPPFAPPPLLHVPGCPLFPRSCNPRRSLPHEDSLESAMHRRRLRRRLERGDLSPSENRSIASFAGRRTALKERLSLHLDDNAVDYRHIKPTSAGLRKWADRPCFEDRLQVLLAEDVPSTTTDEPVWTRVAPATGFGVAALEYSVALEMLAGLYEDEAPGPGQQQEEPRASEPDSAPFDFLRLDTQLPLDLTPPLSPSPSTLSPSSPSEALSPASLLPATPPVSSPPMGSSSSSGASSHSQSRNQQYKAMPSPLRMEAMSSSSSSSHLIASPASAATSATAVASPPTPATIASPPASAPPVPLKSALKQGVRFVEGEKDDKADGLPFGYVQRIKQKREEKARFLQAERERRRHEDERRKHEEERRKWEEERAAWEREKRAIEEERKKRMYADEIAAARSRRESMRFGSLGATTGEGLATGQWDRNERYKPERESSSSTKYTRPAYDPAAHAHPLPVRSGSDSSLSLPKPSRTGGSGSGSGSPGDSRPSSVYGANNVSGSSRPTSLYGTPSSSQQDVRVRERKVSGSGSRRGSMVSESGGAHRRPESIPVPPPPMPQMWGMGMPMNVPQMSPMMPMSPMQGVPMGMAMPMPMYGMGMDMPLLPPSPPFMMQQYGYRPPSQNSNRNSTHSTHSPSRSHSSSPTMGRNSLPASSSSERVNRLSQSHGSSQSARAPSVPRSESTPHHPRHHRTSSGEFAQRPSAGVRSHSDDRRSSKVPAPTPQRPVPTHSSSLPPHPPPSFNQARQSWALPKSGFENVSRPSASQSGRRQTVIS
ncbi:hypothetical protein FKP32DRAFT_1676681 [Trametes sanguinea]|nr:hypothetical protein FKP32DRAFT_1676681 [Trametes sanguinea]